KLMGKVLESPILFAEPVAYRYTHVIEKQLGGVLTFKTDLVEQPALGKAGPVCLHAHQCKILAGRIQLGSRYHQVGVTAIGNKGLLPRHYVFITFLSWYGAHGSQVTADSRLAHGNHADHLAADHFG